MTSFPTRVPSMGARGPAAAVAMGGVACTLALASVLLSSSARQAVAVPANGGGPPTASPAGAPRDPGDEAKGADIVKVTQAQIDAQKVGVARIEKGKVQLHVEVPATVALDATRVAQVPARVVGTVADMRKKLGDAVAAGEVVAVLDSREVADAKSEYLTASTDLELQKTLYERSKALWEKRVAPETQYLQVSTAFAQTSLRVQIARQKLSALGIDAEAATRDFQDPKRADGLRRYELRAPIAGRVIARKVDVGTAVGKEGEPSSLYAIADLSKLWLEMQVRQADLVELKEGDEVTIRGPGDPGAESKASVTFIDPALDAETRNARVIATLDDGGRRWRPGTFVDARIDFGGSGPRLVAPRAAVQRIEGRPRLFVRTPDGFRAQEVKLGAADDAAVEILSGVEEGDEIAVANAFLLKAELGKSEAEGD